VGHRIEKVYAPYPDVWTFKLASRLHLILICSARRKAFFLSPSRPGNPFSPSPQVQWWRKRLQKRRIISYRMNWPQRQLALGLSPGQGEWLVLDLKEGMRLEDALPAGFDQDPDWPELSEILSESTLYLSYPQLTPPLRRTLAWLQHEKAASLLEQLKSGWVRHFYGYARNGRLAEVLPYQRPERPQEEVQLYDSARQAACDLGWSILGTMDDPRAREDAAVRSERRRLKKLLGKVDQDQERLQALAGLRERAELIRANLFQLQPNERADSLDLQDSAGTTLHVDLDPAMTILENMEHLFRKARKGERGLAFISRRRAELESALAELDSGRAVPTRAPSRAGTVRKAKSGSKSSSDRFQGLRVHEFVSQDGFTIARGRDQKANHRLLTRGARPFDLWFHAENGPGAHVVLRRDHDNQAVPRRTLLQAAMLAGLASYQAGESEARVSMALVKHVHPVKGAAPGQARVDQVQESLLVPLDPGLEAQLRKKGPA